MFVLVACTKCAKSFQVAKENLGLAATCPWCQSVVTALPIATTAAQQVPLSLDDDPPTLGQSTNASAASDNGFASFFTLRTAAISLIVVVIVTGITVAGLGYGSQRIPATGWSRFTAPDGSCSILLHGAPTEEQLAPNPAGSATGKRFVFRGWYTRTSSWIAWNDLEPSFARTVLEKDKEKVFTATAIDAELTREKTRLQATVTKQAELRLNTAWGVEVHFDTPTGKAIEWFLLVADNPRPRLYVFGLQGKNIAPDSAVVRSMFTSFKIEN